MNIKVSWGLSNFMSIKQKRVLMKSFESQFGYCPLIWIFHGRGVNNKINHLQERSILIACKDDNNSFKDLLKKDNIFTVHHRNIQSLAIELFKVKENLSNTIMNDILQTRTLTYNLFVLFFLIIYLFFPVSLQFLSYIQKTYIVAVI